MNNVAKVVEEVIKHLPTRHNQKTHGKLGLNEKLQESIERAKPSGYGDVRIPKTRHTVKIGGHTVDITVSTSGEKDIQKVFGKDTKVVIDDLASAYLGGIELLPKGAKLSLTIDATEYDIEINGKVVHNDKKLVAFNRFFERQGKTVFVDHSSFVVSKGFQGNGYGSEMFFASEAAYKKMGVGAITLSADMDVGGYAWARMGFDFSDAYDRRDLRDQLKSRLTDLSYDKKIPDRVLSKAWKVARTLRYPFEIAAFSIKDASGNIHKIGKDVLLKSDWGGIKILDSKSKTYVAGLKYRRLKRKK